MIFSSSNSPIYLHKSTEWVCKQAMTETKNYAEILAKVIDAAKTHGATAADGRIRASQSVSVNVFGGKLEGLEREESHGLALRCFVGKQAADVSGSDMSDDALNILVERCVAMAKAAPEDPYGGIADMAALSSVRDLDSMGEAELSPEFLETAALEAEAAAQKIDEIAHVSDCGAGWSASQIWVAASNGFYGAARGSSCGVGLAAVASRGEAMERDYESRSTRFMALQPTPEEIGRIAAQRAVARLGAQKPKTQNGPVIFDRRVSAGLVRAMLGAISGPSVARGVSFLKDKLGEQIFSESINIIDNPSRENAMGNRVFDGDGLPVNGRAIIENGTLTQWLLNLPAARQLDLVSNGYAVGGFGGPPGVGTANVTLENGSDSPEALMAQAGTGLLVTSMFGPSINPNTGDYSVGVSGQWFESGEAVYPVAEVTIASNLLEMYKTLIPANDLELRGTCDAPSLLIPNMMIAGA